MMETFFATWDIDLDSPEKNKNELFDSMLTKLKENPENVDVCWRLVEACLVLADSCEKVKNRVDAKKHTEESLKYAKMAVEMDPDSMLAHKWYCAAIGRLSPHVGTKERIKCGYEFKEHRDIAIKLDSNDKLMHHMYGRWCYEVASLSYIERKIAETFFAKPPSSSYQEALESLLKADSLSSNWKSNKLWLAKVYIALKNYTEAIKCIDTGLTVEIQTEEDAVSENELKELEKSYSKYRK